MSRFDHEYLIRRKVSSWKDAYHQASQIFDCPWTSIKQLRDEFDALFPNSRLGWHNREARPEIRRTFDEVGTLDPDLHFELVDAVLIGREEEVSAVTAVIDPAETALSVAERLKTGRLAEEWFFETGHLSLKLARSGLVDRRLDAIGFDFGVSGFPEIAIEVKGLAGRNGGILMTEKERAVAHEMRDNYLLAVVTEVVVRPKLHVYCDPTRLLVLQPTKRFVQTTSWQARLSTNSLQSARVN